MHEFSFSLCLLIMSVVFFKKKNPFSIKFPSLSLFKGDLRNLVLFFGVNVILSFYTSVSYMESFLVDCIIGVKME